MGAIVFGLMGCTASPLFAQPAVESDRAFSASTSDVFQRAAGAARGDDVAQAMAVVWYGNEIEAAAIQKLLAARKPDDQLTPILRILEDLRTSLGILQEAAQCRWACPPGDCSPDCIPRPVRSSPASRPPLDLAKILAILRWHVNVVENAGLEALMRGQTYDQVKKQLGDARGKIGQLR